MVLRRTPPGSSIRSFPRAPLFSSLPVCWAVLIKESVSMSIARNGPWKDFGMCPCVGTGIESVSDQRSPALPVSFSTLHWQVPRSISSRRARFRVRLHVPFIVLQSSAIPVCAVVSSGSMYRRVAYAVESPWFPGARPSS